MSQSLYWVLKEFITFDGCLKSAQGLSHLSTGCRCIVTCNGGKICRQFGKFICLCEKGKRGSNCEENGMFILVV